MRINEIIHATNISLRPNPTYLQVYEAFELPEIQLIPLLYESGELAGTIYRSDFVRHHPDHFQLNDVVTEDVLYDHYHILETLREFLKVDRTRMPVVDPEGFFMGVCELHDVQYHFNRTIGLTEGSSMMVIQTTLQNYSLVDIGRIVESNQAKVLNFYLSSHPDSNQIEITLVLNVTDIIDIIATFNRFDYYVTYSTASKEQDSLLKERYDSLMHFLDI